VALPLYRPTQHLALGRWARASLMPAQYRAQILALDGTGVPAGARALQTQ
jgi:NADPH-dependent ferric siderophore reductase